MIKSGGGNCYWNVSLFWMFLYLSEEEAKLRAIPLGGDQLTCERIRGAHIVRLDGDTPEERLEGCIAMIEDFHEKMNFLQVKYLGDNCIQMFSFGEVYRWL